MNGQRGLGWCTGCASWPMPRVWVERLGMKWKGPMGWGTVRKSPERSLEISMAQAGEARLDQGTICGGRGNSPG